MAKRTLAFLVPTLSPGDTSGLSRLFDAGAVAPSEVVAILGKTEGNGGRNDFTRELATRALAALFASRLNLAEAAIEDRIVLSFSGGVEGVVTPHLVVFAVRDQAGDPVTGAKRLAIAVGATRTFSPEEIGRTAQIEETARVIRELAAELGVDSPADVHLVQMKGAIPRASFEEAEAARKAGRPLRSDMVHSRGASALAAAVALGEVATDRIKDEAVCSDWSLFSSVASVSAKPGLQRTEIMLLANSPSWTGDLRIEHGVLADIIDADGVRAILEKLSLPSPLSAADRARIIGVFAKSEADARGTIRGHRHTMLEDDDISDTRYSRCALASVIASVIGTTAIYVSTRAEHMGPIGGGPLAIVARVD